MLARETQGYEVQWASTDGEAVSVIDQTLHDVYLVDYRLGHQSGLDLLPILAEREIHAPFILMTGQNERDLDLKVLQAGVVDYLDKAVLKPGILNRIVRYALQRYRDLEAVRASESN